MIEESTDSVLSFITSLSIDVFITAALIVAATMIVLRLRKGRAIALLLSLIIGYALYVAFPFYGWVQSLGGTTLLPINIFLVGIFSYGAFFFMRKHIQGAFAPGKTRRLIEAGVIGTLLVGLAISILYRTSPISNFYLFSGVLKLLFVSYQALFWWILATLAACTYILRR